MPDLNPHLSLTQLLITQLSVHDYQSKILPFPPLIFKIFLNLRNDFMLTNTTIDFYCLVSGYLIKPANYALNLCHTLINATYHTGISRSEIPTCFLVPFEKVTIYGLQPSP